jgi:hypothetical protein
MNTINSLLDKIARAEALDFSDVISDTVDLFKKVWLKGLLVVVFIVISAFCIGFVFRLIGLSQEINPNIFVDGFNLEAFASFYATNIIYSIPQTILVSTITLALVAAFYRICNQITSGDDGNEDYFFFFNKEYFSKVFMLGIIHAGIGVLAQLLFFVSYLYFFVPLAYFAVILANNPNLSEMEIVKASFALGNKKWLITFGTMFVAGLMAMLGLIGCFIGVFFTISIVYLPVYLIYKESIGLNYTTEIDKIGSDEESNY